MHKLTGKLKIGPGGVKCRCCRPLPGKALKVKTNRYLRRKAKENLNQEN